MNKPYLRKSSRRDVLIHAAVTIMPTAGGHQLVGEREVELGQFAVEFPSSHGPISEAELSKAFLGLAAHCLGKMRSAGLIK